MIVFVGDHLMWGALGNVLQVPLVNPALLVLNYLEISSKWLCLKSGTTLVYYIYTR